MFKESLLIIACSLHAVFAPAQSGMPDPSFGTNGHVITNFGSNFNRAMAVAINNEGKVFAAGSAQDLDGDDFGADFAVAKYNEDGSLANDFGNNGLVVTDIDGQSSDVATDIAIQGDGKILVAGRSHAGTSFENYNFSIVRYDPDGTLDPSFGSQGKVMYPYETFGDYSYKVSMAVQADGKILMTGTCYDFPSDDFLTVRFTPAGQVDSTFGINGKVKTSLGEGFDGFANAVALQSDGKILVGGLIHGSISYPTGVDFALVRYEPDGTPDLSFGTNGTVLTPVVDGSGYEWIEDLAIQSDGKIIAIGNTDVLVTGNNIYRVAMVKYNPDGTLDTSFGTSGIVLTDLGSLYPYATGVALTVNEDIIVSGNCLNQNNQYDFVVAKFSVNGVPVIGFGMNGMTSSDINPLESFLDVKIQSDGKIVAAGLTGDQEHHEFALIRYLDGVTGNDEPDQVNNMELFPNPVNDQLTIRLPAQKNFNLSIMTMDGKKLFFTTLQGTENTIDVHNLPAGMYMLMLVKNNEIVFHRKMIKL